MAILIDRGYVNVLIQSNNLEATKIIQEYSSEGSNLLKLVQDRRHGLRVFEVSPLEGKEDMDSSTLKRIILLFKGFGKGY
ncbi:hypothetical protein Goshw_018173, partial [Gossypium schwendimanii]|nr:hypothetical protein [Gossypium schwendimanii]